MSDPKWLEEDKAKYGGMSATDVVRGLESIKEALHRAHAHIDELREKVCNTCSERYNGRCDKDPETWEANNECLLRRDTPPDAT